MASSLQKDNLANDIKEVLGLSNVDFNRYNYKPTKALIKVIDIISTDLTAIDIKIMRDNKTDLLFSISFEGYYGKLSKPMVKTLHSISATEWHPNKIEMFIGSHHAGFDGLIVAAEVIRRATGKGIAVSRRVMHCSADKRTVELAVINGSKMPLKGWNYIEKGYIFRQCGISEVNLDAFANYEVEDFRVKATEECLVVELNGVRSINSSFKLRFIDNEVIGFDLDKCDPKELSAFKAWLVVRGKNVQDLYRNALFEQKRAAIKERLANGNEAMDVVRQMVIVSAQIACGKGLEHVGSFEELDKLAEQYLKLRKEHK